MYLGCELCKAGVQGWTYKWTFQVFDIWSLAFRKALSASCLSSSQTGLYWTLDTLVAADAPEAKTRGETSFQHQQDQSLPTPINFIALQRRITPHCCTEDSSAYLQESCSPPSKYGRPPLPVEVKIYIQPTNQPTNQPTTSLIHHMEICWVTIKSSQVKDRFGWNLRMHFAGICILWRYQLRHFITMISAVLKFWKSDIGALPVSNLSAAPITHGCIPVPRVSSRWFADYTLFKSRYFTNQSSLDGEIQRWYCPTWVKYFSKFSSLFGDFCNSYRRLSSTW